MRTYQHPVSDPGSLKLALALLKRGGLVAFPTDTVYGLGASAFNEAGVESIYKVKGRSIEKAIPVLVAHARDLDRVAASVPDMARRLGARFWPGPLTLIVPKHSALPDAVSSGPGVAVRIPAHATARALLELSGPLAVTSANRSGSTSPVNAREVARQLDGRIPLILDGGQTPGGIPSTLVDCLGEKPVILRQGPVEMRDLVQVLEG